MPFIDLHCDTVSRLLATRRAGQPGSLRQADFHIDLEKLKGSGYLLQNFALFVNLKGGRDPLPGGLDPGRSILGRACE